MNHLKDGKRYKLLKDLPGYSAGTVFENGFTTWEWFHGESDRLPNWLESLLNNPQNAFFPDFFEATPLQPIESRYSVTLDKSQYQLNDVYTVFVNLYGCNNEQAEAVVEAFKKTLAYIHRPTEANALEYKEAVMDAADLLQKGTS